MKYKILVLLIVIFGHLSISIFVKTTPNNSVIKIVSAKEDEDDGEDEDAEENEENENDSDDDGRSSKSEKINVSTPVKVSAPVVVTPRELPSKTIQNPMLLKAPEKVEIEEREMNSVEKLNQISQPENIENMIKQKVISNPELGTTLENLNLKSTVQEGKEILEGTGLKTENLFGLFKVQIPVSVQIDSKTGEVIKTNKSLWNIILDYLSF